ncbi:MAG: sigma 54-interacting transcriptional regulator [Desulfobacteraceae bacterium]|nr:sigma 54-interacting transcriptional regulator [Desulfobacteraceae bacterium]
MNPEITEMDLKSYVHELEKELAGNAETIAALKESEDRFHRMMEIMKEEFLFYRHDTNCRFTYVSPSYANILGYQPEEYIGKHVEELWSDNPINKEADRNTKLSAVGIRQPPYELEICQKNGVCRRFIVIEAPIFDKDGEVVAVEGIARDITEKRRIEEKLEKYRKHLENLVQQRTIELQSSQKQLHDIIDFLPDPTYVVDKNHSIIAWNRAMVAISGVAEDKAVDRPYHDLIKCIYDSSQPVLVETVLNMHADYIESPVSDDERARLKESGITRYGSIFFCTRYMPHMHGGHGGYVWITAAPILNSDNEITGAIESIRDVTQIKNAEIKLQESERRLSTLMSNLPGMAYRIVQRDRDWKVEFVSEGCRQIFGYESSVFINRGVHEFRRLIHPDDVKNVVDQAAGALSEKKPFHCEFRILTEDDKDKWLFNKTEILSGQNGDAVCIEGFMADFTIYKQMEKRLKKENQLLRSTIRDRYKFKDIIGNCQAMQDVYEMIVKAATSDDNVFILGESGTGKDLVAQAIHRESNRKDGPFVAVNCAAIPENLAESEFFGASKGAFTGASSEKTGYLEAADKGVLFLDEIGDLDPRLQVKLLRAIDGGGFSPLGSRRIVRPDVRIIAASNRNLEQLVSSGEMRQDFFFRIHVIPIHLPPLRERGDDIFMLANHFLKLYSPDDDLFTLSRKEWERLKKHQWPGNVRELQNVIKRYLALRNLNFFKPAQNQESEVQPSPESGETSAIPAEGANLHEAVATYEKKIILAGLEKARWNKTRTAQELGISRKTLFRKMKAFDLM